MSQYVSIPGPFAASSFVLQLAASKAAVFGETKALSAVKMAPARRSQNSATVCMAGAPAYVPDMNRRNIMNLALAGAVALPGTAVLGGWLFTLVPPSSGGGGGGVVARDAVGSEITATKWLATHPAGDRTLAEGLKVSYRLQLSSGHRVWGLLPGAFFCPIRCSQVICATLTARVSRFCIKHVLMCVALASRLWLPLTGFSAETCQRGDESVQGITS